MSLPESKDYLATTTRKLLQIFGESDEKGHLALFGLRVHEAALLFEDCPNHSKDKCKCERLLQILSKSLLSFKSVAPPGPGAEQGCIIIGRVMNVLRSPKSSSDAPIFCLPNSQILQAPSDRLPQSPSESEEEEGSVRFWSSTMPTLDATPPTSISQDPSQNEETFSTSSADMGMGVSSSTAGKCHPRARSIVPNNVGESSCFTPRPPGPQRKFREQVFNDGNRVAKSSNLRPSSQRVNSGLICVPKPEALSLSRAICELGPVQQDSMQSIADLDTRSTASCQDNMQSAKSVRKQRAQDFCGASSALSANPSRTLRRRPHFGLREEGFGGSSG
jgi:hypothetical protein